MELIVFGFSMGAMVGFTLGYVIVKIKMKHYAYHMIDAHTRKLYANLELREHSRGEV